MLGVDMSSGDGIIGERNHGGQMDGCVSRGVPLYGTAILIIHLCVPTIPPSRNSVH